MQQNQISFKTTKENESKKSLLIMSFLLNIVFLFVLFQKPNMLSWLYEIKGGWFVSSITISSIWFFLLVPLLALLEQKKDVSELKKILLFAFIGINLFVWLICLLVNFIFHMF